MMNRSAIYVAAGAALLVGAAVVSWAKAVGRAEQAKVEAHGAIERADSLDRRLAEVREQSQRQTDSLRKVGEEADARAAAAEAHAGTERARANQAAAAWRSALSAVDSAATPAETKAAISRLVEAHQEEVSGLRASNDGLSLALAEERAALAVSREETASERRRREAAEDAVEGFRTALAKSQAESRAWEAAATGVRGLFGIKIPSGLAFIAGGAVGAGATALIAAHM